MRNRRSLPRTLFYVALLGQASGLLFLGVAAAAPSAAQPMAGMALATAQARAGAQTPVVALHQSVVRVTIHNFTFKPARLVVSPNTRVVWTNTDSDPHTVDSVKGVWTSEALDTDGHFARTFKSAGTFSYYCSIHPFMHGVIVVKK